MCAASRSFGLSSRAAAARPRRLREESRKAQAQPGHTGTFQVGVSFEQMALLVRAVFGLAMPFHPPLGTQDDPAFLYARGAGEQGAGGFWTVTDAEVFCVVLVLAQRGESHSPVGLITRATARHATRVRNVGIDKELAL